MTIELQESLAQMLYKLYYEAIGVNSAELDFNSEPDYIKEAWVQVAQWVQVRDFTDGEWSEGKANE